MKLFISILFIIFIVNIPSLVYSIKENNDDFNIYHHLSVKSPYWRPGGTNTTEPPTGCKLGHIEYVARHGNRYPTKNYINILNNLNGFFNPYAEQLDSEYKWILNWTSPYKTKDAGLLILQGQYEHYNISKRFLQRFKGFFSPYNPNNYGVTATYVSRTDISASSFMYGLFENTGKLGPQKYQPVSISVQSGDEDYLLRFFSICQSYKKLIDSNIINDQEKEKYLNMTLPEIGKRVAVKMGLLNSWEPTNSVIYAMLSACAYDLSILGVSNKWCTLFSEQDILQWEYAEDLSNYWMKSYGHKENYIISSLLFQDMMKGIDLFMNHTKDYQPKYGLRFAHAETIIPFVSLLGLYKDDYMLFANNSQEQIDNRKWRSSDISPYAANVALLLYQCDGGDYKIRVDHNEVGIQVPGCDDLYCDYNQFKSVFTEAMNFNWTTTCNVNNNNNNNNNTHRLLIILGIVLVSIVLGLIVGIIFTKIYLHNKSGYENI